MTPVQLVWLGGILSVVGLALLAYAKPFAVEKINAIGLEFKLKQHFESPGYPRLRPLAILILLVGIAVSTFGGYRIASPPTWPTLYSAVTRAEIQASEVDDIVLVRVNDVDVITVSYGETPPWTDVKQHLKQGNNKIEVIIQNGQYGGCGGTVAIKLNGLENQAYRWTWAQPVNQAPNVVCFAQVKTLELR